MQKAKAAVIHIMQHPVNLDDNPFLSHFKAAYVCCKKNKKTSVGVIKVEGRLYKFSA